jgi:hypothetical protein
VQARASSLFGPVIETNPRYAVKQNKFALIAYPISETVAPPTKSHSPSFILVWNAAAL